MALSDWRYLVRRISALPVHHPRSEENAIHAGHVWKGAWMGAAGKPLAPSVEYFLQQLALMDEARQTIEQLTQVEAVCRRQLETLKASNRAVIQDTTAYLRELGKERRYQARWLQELRRSSGLEAAPRSGRPRRRRAKPQPDPVLVAGQTALLQLGQRQHSLAVQRERAQINLRHAQMTAASAHQLLHEVRARLTQGR
jgi:hypothetical protein